LPYLLPYQGGGTTCVGEITKCIAISLSLQEYMNAYYSLPQHC